MYWLWLLVKPLSFTGRVSASLLLLAILTHFSLTSILYVLPILLLLISSPLSNLASPRHFHLNTRETAKQIFPLASEYFAYLVTLAVASTVLSGGKWGWVGKTWGAS